jgi:hypothetical protein
VPLLVLPLLLVLVVLASIALLPLTLVQRYRVGTARRPARRWVISLNLVAIGVSTAVFVLTAALASLWLPSVFMYTVIGLVAGCVLGLAGLALTRWEGTSQSLHYTPNRWLVLSITLIVTGRVLYGFWRSWQAWGAGLDYTAWVASSGVAGSMGAAAVVLGHYLIYWLGVRRRLKRHKRVEQGR